MTSYRPCGWRCRIRSISATMLCSSPGSSSLGSFLGGPARTLCTHTPGDGCSTAGCDAEVDRVKISTSTPVSARAAARALTYTFIPPASPEPGCSMGEVCRERKATRRISDTVPLSPADFALPMHVDKTLLLKCRLAHRTAPTGPQQCRFAGRCRLLTWPL